MRQPPCIVLIAPPIQPGGQDIIVREGGQRQQWQLVTLDAPQLDYYDLAALQPGWRAWCHAGRYLSTHTVAWLTWAALTAPQPLPPGLEE